MNETIKTLVGRLIGKGGKTAKKRGYPWDDEKTLKKWAREEATEGQKAKISLLTAVPGEYVERMSLNKAEASNLVKELLKKRKEEADKERKSEKRKGRRKSVSEKGQAEESVNIGTRFQSIRKSDKGRQKGSRLKNPENKFMVTLNGSLEYNYFLGSYFMKVVEQHGLTHPLYANCYRDTETDEILIRIANKRETGGFSVRGQDRRAEHIRSKEVCQTLIKGGYVTKEDGDKQRFHGRYDRFITEQPGVVTAVIKKTKR